MVKKKSIITFIITIIMIASMGIVSRAEIEYDTIVDGGVVKLPQGVNCSQTKISDLKAYVESGAMNVNGYRHALSLREGYLNAKASSGGLTQEEMNERRVIAIEKQRTKVNEDKVLGRTTSSTTAEDTTQSTDNATEVPVETNIGTSISTDGEYTMEVNGGIGTVTDKKGRVISIGTATTLEEWKNTNPFPDTVTTTVGDLVNWYNMCDEEHRRNPGPGNGSDKVSMGGQVIQVGMDPSGRVDVGMNSAVLGQTATSETANTLTKAKEIIVGKTADTAAVAYICGMAKDKNGIYNEAQIAIWSSKLAIEISRAKNELAKEADAYAKFFEDYEKAVKANGGKLEVKDNYSSDKVSTDQSNPNDKLILIGPLNLSYARGVYNRPDGTIVDFGGITSIKVIAEDGKEIPEEAIQVVPMTVKEGKQRNIPEYDKAYAFPYPGEEFYIIIHENKAKGAKKIKEIQYGYHRMYVEAKIAIYRGTYNKLTWSGRAQLAVCELGWMGFQVLPTGQRIPEPHPCPHGYTIKHTYPTGYYIEITGREEKEAQETSQIIEIKKQDIPTTSKTPGKTSSSIPYIIPTDWTNWPIWPHYYGGDDDDDDEPDIPEDDLKFTIAGIVWEDERVGKESNFDGQIGNNNNGTKENGIENVEVKLYKHGETTPIKSTYTDKYGAYIFNELDIDKYDVGFVYDGLTYTTTQSFAGGSVEDYIKNPNDEKYVLTSKVNEDAMARQNFNNKFYEISPEGSKNMSGGITNTESLTYITQDGTSAIQTKDALGRVKTDFQLESRTPSNVSYPLTDYTVNATKSKVIAGQEYTPNYVYMAYVNLGLQRRPEVDFALAKDVDVATVTINNKKETYKYNARRAYLDESYTFDIAFKKSPAYSSDIKYNRSVYESDYKYRIDDYVVENVNEVGTVSRTELINELTSMTAQQKKDQELNVFVTYQIKLRNQSDVYSGTINKLVDYYDHTYSLIKENKQLDILGDDGVLHQEIVAYAPYYEKNGVKQYLTVSDDGKYNDKYNKVFLSGMGDEILRSSGNATLTLYVTFQVNKDDLTRTLDIFENGNPSKPEEKSNQVEIYSYSTFTAEAVTKSDPSSVVGMIDRDSAPGNLDPMNNNTLEDDSDIAPSFTIKWYEGTQRTINGIVWEDERTHTISTTGQEVGDGIRQQTEKKVNGVKIQLVEKITTKSGKQYEYIWREMYSGENTYKYVDMKDGNVLDANIGQMSPGSVETNTGEYKFTDYIPGDYVVRFIYGQDQKTIAQTPSYNGHDYKSTAYWKGYNKDYTEEWYDLGSDYLNQTPISDARDNEARRVEVMNYSRTIKNEQAKVLASHAKGDSYDKKLEELYMFADTAKIRADVEKNLTVVENGNLRDAEVTYNIIDIDFGLEQRPTSTISLEKEIIGIRITLADGTILVDTENGIRKNVNVVKNDKINKLHGNIHIYMDEEVMQGANIQVKYKITARNDSEVDYTGATADSVGRTYYTGEYSSSDKIVTTKVDVIGDYVDNNLVYRLDDNQGRGWESTTAAEMEPLYMDPENKITEKNINQILLNKIQANNELRPAVNKDERGTAEYVLVLTKTLSSADNEDDQTYDNIAEILQFSNSVGRRANIPGNQDPKAEITSEPDSDNTETIIITKPYGENRAHYYVLAGVVLTLVAGGVFVIKKKVIDK
ncbi:MAG: hypothetical protein IJ223_01050 [Clostridia bacterium]|nr:hypothetical protein [Clostridia bacterium]